MNELLQAKAQESRARIAELRALRRGEKPVSMEIESLSDQTSQKIVKVIETLEPVELNFPGVIPTLSDVYIPPPEHIPERDVSGNVIDLAMIHGISGEVCVTLAEIMESSTSEEFEQKDILDALQKGMIVNLGIPDFKYFKILKVCSSEAGNDLFIVNFKYKNSKPAKVTLILKFNYPIKPGTGIAIISPRKQEQLGRIHMVESIEINTKNVLEKMLEKLGF